MRQISRWRPACRIGWGGKGANQAVAARLCGADVDMVCRVGDDLFGSATIANFKAQGIGAEHVRIVRDTSSGVAPISEIPLTSLSTASGSFPLT